MGKRRFPVSASSSSVLSPQNPSVTPNPTSSDSDGHVISNSLPSDSHTDWESTVRKLTENVEVHDGALADHAKKQQHSSRVFSDEDEVILLKRIIEYSSIRGMKPSVPSSTNMDEFYAFVQQSLSSKFSKRQISDKIRRLKTKHMKTKGKLPSDPHQKELFEISCKIWGTKNSNVASSQAFQQSTPDPPNIGSDEELKCNTLPVGSRSDSGSIPEPIRKCKIQKRANEGTNKKQPKSYADATSSVWTDKDEIALLKGILEYSAIRGMEPSVPSPDDMDEFHAFIQQSMCSQFSKRELSDKICNFRIEYVNNLAAKGRPPSDPHQKALFDMSSKIWGKRNCDDVASADIAQPTVSGQKKGGSSSDFVSDFLKIGLQLDGDLQLSAELKDKLKELRIAELESFIRKSELVLDQLMLLLHAVEAKYS